MPSIIKKYFIYSVLIAITRYFTWIAMEICSKSNEIINAQIRISAQFHKLFRLLQIGYGSLENF